MIRFSFPDGRAEALVTGREDGDLRAAPRADRESLVERHLAATELLLLEQVHSSTVVSAEEAREQRRQGDALVGFGPAALGVLTADCVPIVLADRGGAVATVHAGWRGLAAGVVEAAADRLGSEVEAFVGPHIRACCYEFRGPERPGLEQRFPECFHGDYLSLDAALGRVFEEIGVTIVGGLDECTMCSGRFFSYRGGSRAERFLTAARSGDRWC